MYLINSDAGNSCLVGEMWSVTLVLITRWVTQRGLKCAGVIETMVVVTSLMTSHSGRQSQSTHRSSSHWQGLHFIRISAAGIPEFICTRARRSEQSVQIVRIASFYEWVLITYRHYLT